MRKTPNAFTLAELTITLAIVSVIALSAAGVSVAISSAHARGESVNENVQTGRAALMRLQWAINRAKLVTSAGSDWLVLWASDDNNDGQVNVSELKSISFDGPSQSVKSRQVEFPAAMSSDYVALLNDTVALSSLTGMSDSAVSVISGPYVQEDVMATGVTALAVSVSPSCPMATLVTVKVTVNCGGEEMTLRSAAALRADRTADVAVADGQYLLCPSTNVYGDDGTVTY